MTPRQTTKSRAPGTRHVPSRQARRFYPPWMSPLALAALVGIAYATVYRAGFIWDDDLWVTENVHLRSLEGLGRMWTSLVGPQYYPITLTTFWIEAQIWGLNPFPFHLTNIILHALNTVLVWLLLRGLGVRGAWAAAAIFAVHPVHVESVAWITERKNVLSGFFTLLAIVAYLRCVGVMAPLREILAFQRTPQTSSLSPPPSTRASAGWYALTVAAFILAMLSKTVAATTPAVILVILWWKRGRIGGRDVLRLAPLFVIGVGLGLFTVWVERTHIGATGEEWVLTLLERVMIAGRALWFYAGKLLWPHPITFFYPRWEIDGARIELFVFPAGAVMAGVGLWVRRRAWGRGPLAAALIFAGTLFPALGFFNVYPMRYSFVADHFQYMASVSLIALIVSAVGSALDRIEAPRLAGRVALGVALAALVAICWREGRNYRDQEALYLSVIAENPQAWMAHHNYGKVLSGEGRLEEAAAQFERALAIRPHHKGARLDLGVAQFRLGRLDDALITFATAAELAPDDPEPLNNWGNVLMQKQLFAEAEDKYRAALRLDPDYVDAHMNLGAALLMNRKADEAAAAFREALARRPDFADAHFNLGQALETAGRLGEAAEAYREAIRLRPGRGDDYRRLGRLLRRMGELEESARVLEAGRRLGSP